MTIRCHLVNTNEYIVYSFDAKDVEDARQTLTDRCMMDQANYDLAIVTRRATIVNPTPPQTVIDVPAFDTVVTLPAREPA